MKIISKTIRKNFFIAVLGGVLLSGCYEKFDESSYAPEFTISGYTAVDQIETTNLVAYWPFDGDLKETLSGNSGANTGATFVNGFQGGAVSMDVGNKSYFTFDAGSAITGLQSFTISFWVNPVFVDANSDNGIDGIIGLVNLSNSDGFWGNIDWFVENGSNPTAATIKVHVTGGATDSWVEVTGYKGLFNTWSNHTFTYNAETSELAYYINGSIAKKGTSSWGGAAAFSNSGPMVFGCVQFQTTPSLTSATDSQPWASYLTGAMDEVRIYNSALVAEDINALVVLQGKGK